jgi:hypothetical protein
VGFCDDDIVKESAGPKFAMYFTVTPVADRTSVAWTYVAKDYENIPVEVDAKSCPPSGGINGSL